MTPSQLKMLHEQHNPYSFYFSRETMRYFGDTMRNYGVRSATIKAAHVSEDDFQVTGASNVEVWELWRKKPVANGHIQASSYFDKATFAVVHGEKISG